MLKFNFVVVVKLYLFIIGRRERYIGRGKFFLKISFWMIILNVGLEFLMMCVKDIVIFDMFIVVVI